MPNGHNLSEGEQAPPEHARERRGNKDDVAAGEVLLGWNVSDKGSDAIKEKLRDRSSRWQGRSVGNIVKKNALRRRACEKERHERSVRVLKRCVRIGLLATHLYRR